ncbi:MAG: hypothetical protein D6784_00390 [Chloroflexi bacterium]|nr:MAG: hypothetical protein D6784_00390 [Chloroflexota bacterium]
MLPNILAQKSSSRNGRHLAEIIEWRNHTRRTIATLRHFESLLASWQTHPPTPEQFNRAVAILADAGLLDWLDGSPQDSITPRPSIDDLAAAVGVEK